MCYLPVIKIRLMYYDVYSSQWFVFPICDGRVAGFPYCVVVFCVFVLWNLLWIGRASGGGGW